MKHLALHRWFVLLTGISFALTAVAQSDSPVGSWFGKLRGAESGTAFLSFNSDQTLTGMGYSHRNVVPFAIRGTWSVGQNGEVRAKLAQITSGVSRPAVAVAMARGGQRLTLKATGAQRRVQPPRASRWRRLGNVGATDRVGFRHHQQRLRRPVQPELQYLSLHGAGGKKFLHDPVLDDSLPEKVLPGL